MPRPAEGLGPGGHRTDSSLSEMQQHGSDRAAAGLDAGRRRRAGRVPPMASSVDASVGSAAVERIASRRRLPLSTVGPQSAVTRQSAGRLPPSAAAATRGNASHRDRCSKRAAGFQLAAAVSSPISPLDPSEAAAATSRWFWPTFSAATFLALAVAGLVIYFDRHNAVSADAGSATAAAQHRQATDRPHRNPRQLPPRRTAGRRRTRRRKSPTRQRLPSPPASQRRRLLRRLPPTQPRRRRLRFRASRRRKADPAPPAYAGRRRRRAVNSHAAGA